MKPATQPVTHTPGPWTLETVRTSVGVCHQIGPLGSSTKIKSACLYDDCYSAQPRDLQLLADARLIAAAPKLLRVVKDAADFLLRTARVLDEWAVQSQNGGWSTHQVEGNLRVANDCRREADCIQRVIDRATGAEGTQGEQR